MLLHNILKSCRAIFIPGYRINDYAKSRFIDIVSGSFNPLHDGHRAIAQAIPSSNVYYELSVNHPKKGELSEELIEKTVNQFLDANLPLIITNLPLFKDKAYYFHSLGIRPTFHIGIDTAFRIIEDEGAIDRVENYYGNFRVYPRGKQSINDLPNRPMNFLEGFPIPAEVWDISSTNIRESQYV